MVWAYVTLSSYATKEIPTAAKFNANQGALNTGLDNLQTEMQDTAAAIRGTVSDSALYKTAVNDTINNRMLSTISLPWAMAFGDSFYAGDSLTVEIARSTPIGTVQGLFAHNNVSVVEKVRLILDVVLPSKVMKVDSIRTKIWTERTDGSDYVAFYARGDSTTWSYKSQIADSTGSKYCATARTAQTFGFTLTNTAPVGGKFRIEAIIQMKNSDSLFVGPLELCVTNR